MGCIPVRATIALRDALTLTRAVETGTYEGDGAYELSLVFPDVTTIELSPELHARAAERLHGRQNITLLQGDSRHRLAEMVRADIPTLYFLDGHWSDGFTSGVEDQCPILDELQVIASGHPNDCILIDDARFFLSAPPPPYEPRSWPSIAELIGAFQRTHPSHHVAVIKDQIYAVPALARPVVDDLGRRSLQPAIRRRVRVLLGDTLPPWSPARQTMKRMRRRLAVAIQNPRR